MQNNYNQTTKQIQELVQRLGGKRLEKLKDNKTLSGLTALTQALSDLGKAVGDASGNNGGRARVYRENYQRYYDLNKRHINDNDAYLNEQLASDNRDIQRQINDLSNKQKLNNDILNKRYQIYQNGLQEYKQDHYTDNSKTNANIKTKTNGQATQTTTQTSMADKLYKDAHTPKTIINMPEQSKSKNSKKENGMNEFVNPFAYSIRIDDALLKDKAKYKNGTVNVRQFRKEQTFLMSTEQAIRLYKELVRYGCIRELKKPKDNKEIIKRVYSACAEQTTMNNGTEGAVTKAFKTAWEKANMNSYLKF